MIVYGDPQFSQSFSQAVNRLREHALHLARGAANLDDLRALLVQAGQLEQAVHDALPAQLPRDEAQNQEAQNQIERCQLCTDLAATAFYAQWRQTQNKLAPNESADSLQFLAHELAEWPISDVELNLKLPEGFAFYTLFPEAYAVLALRWMKEHEAEKLQRIAVIGVRSIGTSLSALMKVALQSNGCDAQRLTVRPAGHPFAREVCLDKSELGGAEWFFVVDEGPGLSGSSMASVAQTLHALGVAPQSIVFFPGHPGEPGEQASSSTRFWWNTTTRYVTSTEKLRWNGQALPQILAHRTRELLGADEPVARIDDLSGGLWRAIEYSNETLWPPINAQFERTKFRVTLNDNRAVLWKFAGFVALSGGTATDEMQRELTKRAANNWTVAPLGSCCGFVATPWIEGRPLTRQDATPELLAHIGNYIAECRGTPMTREEAQISRQRLIEMLICNTREALGDQAAESAQFYTEKMQTDELAPTYGDGHLAPHEWICAHANGGRDNRTDDNRVLKTDCWGHSWDHTVIGRQSWLWDVAGAIVEWDLDAKSAAPLLSAVSTFRVGAFSSAELRFYFAAYAAFRLGMLAMSTPDAAHQGAVKFYRQALRRALNNDFEYSITSDT